MTATNWQNSKEKLYRWGILPIDDVPSNVIDHLTNNISNRSHNSSLAGQIKEEYLYENWPRFIDEFVLSKLQDPMLQGWTERQKQLTSNRPFVLNGMWANKQKKYEFNPAHDHAGVFSFIIFLKIPYDLEEEYKVFPQTSTKASASNLVFLITDTLGEIRDIDVPADKSFEGKMLMFPAKLKHLVYPFYTSDDYRITVSGNISLYVEEFQSEDTNLHK